MLTRAGTATTRYDRITELITTLEDSQDVDDIREVVILQHAKSMFNPVISIPNSVQADISSWF